MDARPWTDLDEPVRRYFGHALPAGPTGAAGTRLTMRGRIRVGAWLPFTATWEGDGRSFTWRARVAGGLLRVVDAFADGTGAMDGRLLGRLRVLHAAGPDTARSAAGRAAIEAVHWAPAALLPGRGVTWRAEAGDLVVATWDLPPERPEVHARIDERGAVVSAWMERWQDASRGHVPFGGDVRAHRRFGDLVLPSEIVVGWGYGTPGFAPFFEAEVTAAEPAAERGGAGGLSAAEPAG